MKTQIPIKIGKLYYYANELRKALTDETEIENTDMTNEFYTELENMIKEGEIIIININAKMRLGKSTAAMSLAYHIHTLLQKYKMQPKNIKFGIKNIARDQQEHTEIMKNPKTMYTVIVTDEDNELEHTGANVTTENALNKTLSDVQAARYVHRVCCSPKETVDPNADILLSIVGIDKQTCTTHARLYYKFYEGGIEYTQLLGYIRIPVKHIITEWNKIQKHFLKPNPTSKDKKVVQKTAEKDWYTKYMIQKHEKMELITREGIFRPRILKVAKAIRQTVEQLKPLTELKGVLNTDIIRNFTKQEMSKQKIVTSIIGEDLAVREINGILSLYKSYHETNKQISKRESKTQDKNTIIEIKNLKEIRKTLANAIRVQESEMKRYQIINDKYNTKEEN